MATQVQLRRGTATENNSFTGAQGELTFDTTNKRVRIHDGATAGGFELKTENSSGDTLFADNEKAIFGAGSDLQIYHNGSNSYVQDAGTGKLHITSNGTGVSIDKGTSELMATFDIDGAVTLYHDNAAKLATTSTGVDVTGTLTADALNVSAASPNIDVTDTGTSHASQDFLTNSSAIRATIGVERSAGGGLFVGSSPYAAVFGTASSGNTEFATNNNVRMTISSTGSVGIGATPSTKLHVRNGTNQNFNVFGPNVFSNGVTIASTTDGFTGYLEMEQRATQFAWHNGTTERMRLDASGSVGIGDSNPIGSAQRLYIDHPAATQTALPTVKIRRANNVGGGSAIDEIALDVSVPSTYNNATQVYGIKTYAAHNLSGTGVFGIYSEVEKANSDNHHAGFFRGGHSDTNGISVPKVVYIDQTTTIGGSNSGFSIGCMIKQDNYTKNEFMRWDTDYSGSDTMNALRIYRNSSQVGGITTTTSSTAYNTSSDHRLKENVANLTGATARLNQLAPKRFNFIADADTTVDGFIAHEVQSVVPEAITGTHNEVDADGNPVYQGIDQSKLVPLLVATIKELEARITALENA
jgi:hypothetical protein